MMLPPELRALYNSRAHEIRARLAAFADVPATDWFYELCFCLCTPQSKARHAMMVQQALMDMQFLEYGGDAESLLADRRHYIRFHTTKARRIHALREQWSTLEASLHSTTDPSELRTILVSSVNGIGLKEAGHFLRNVGFRDCAILDRHILRCLVACGVYDTVPSVQAAAAYHAVEERFRVLAEAVAVPIDELDLLFWMSIAGEILK